MPHRWTPTERAWGWFLLALLLYFVRSWAWASADLWHDEAVTVNEFCGVLREIRPLAIFRRYDVANNHFLNSALYWLWFRIVPLQMPEIILRLPSLLAGVGTLALITMQWRHWLGVRLAGLGGILFAVSPVFTAFAYQVRGYGLSMLLSALALTAVLALLTGKRRWPAQALLAICCLLQPLVMPSAVILYPLVALVLTAGLRRRGLPWPGVMAALVPSALGTVAGGSYYLTLLPELRQAAANAAVNFQVLWDAPAALANVLCGLAAHLGWALLLPAAAAVALVRGRGRGGLGTYIGAVMVSGTLATIAAVFLLAGGKQTPFPRNFLLLLPPLTLGVLLYARPLWWPWRRTLWLAAGIVLVAFSLEQVLARRSDVLVQRGGHPPMNLLMQHYRGNRDISAAVSSLQQSGIAGQILLLTGNYDAPALQFYFRKYALDPRRVFGYGAVDPGFAADPSVRKRLLICCRASLYAWLVDYAGCRPEDFNVVQEYHDLTLYAPSRR